MILFMADQWGEGGGRGKKGRIIKFLTAKTAGNEGFICPSV